MAMVGVGDDKLVLLRAMIDLIKEAPTLMADYSEHMNTLEKRYTNEIGGLEKRLTEGLAKVEAEVAQRRAVMEADLATLKSELLDAKTRHTHTLSAMESERVAVERSVATAKRAAEQAMEAFSSRVAMQRSATDATIADLDKSISRKRDELRLVKEALKRAATEAEA